MLADSPNNLSRAVLCTLAYADIFDYPLTLLEIHRYLTGVSAPVEAVNDVLEGDRFFVRIGDFFTLPGREEIVSIRFIGGPVSSAAVSGYVDRQLAALGSASVAQWTNRRHDAAGAAQSASRVRRRSDCDGRL